MERHGEPISNAALAAATYSEQEKGRTLECIAFDWKPRQDSQQAIENLTALSTSAAPAE